MKSLEHVAEWDRPLVSIIISNYNYGQFLQCAIDSALRQTWRRVEVIVVDDGSTDNSHDVIRSYRNLIVPVIKTNGGQSSAFNAGFSVSHGDIICFLDADDVFFPTKVEEVVRAAQEQPHTGLFYHQLFFIDKVGRRIRGRWPSSILRGQLKDRVQSSGGWWPHPTTSALSCTREYLEQIMPMPIEPYKLCADAYIGGLAPFLTRITGIRKPLAMYRQHGENYFSNSMNSETGVRRCMNRYKFEFDQLIAALAHLSVSTREFSLEHHYPYQWCRWRLEDSVSLWNILTRIMRTPSLPLLMKLRAAWNTSVNTRLT